MPSGRAAWGLVAAVGALRGVAGRRHGLRDRGSALRRRAQRTGARDAVHPAQHRGDATGLRARSHRGARADRRRRADARRHRTQPRDARQRPALGSPAAARDVRPDSGDPHLLRLRLGRQRSLRRQRPDPAGHAVGPRAEPGGAAQPHVDQRTARVHARPWPDARPGQPGDRRRTAGAVHSRPAAGLDDQHADHRAEHLLRRAVERVRHRAHPCARVSLPQGRRQRLLRLRGPRRRAAVVVLSQAAVRGALPLVPDPAERRHHDREPAALRPADPRARQQDRAVPDARRRSVPGRRRRPDLLDSGRLHDLEPLSVFERGDRQRQLHPQRGQDRHRRLSRRRSPSISPSPTIRSSRRWPRSSRR